MVDVPLISVVIATYKRPLLLRQAIESVQRQSHRRLEIVVVDDASADSTCDMVHSLGDERVQYIRHERNQGLPAARNTGIRAAQGEYVAFLDDDDEWREDKLEKQLVAIDGHGAVLSAALVNRTRLKCHKKSIVKLDDFRRGNEFDPSSLLIRRNLLNEIMFDETLRQGEDWDAFIRIAERCSIGYVSDPLLLYNDGGHGRMTNEAKNGAVSELEKRMAVLHKHREFFGPFWFKYHVAATLLSFFRHRDRKIYQLVEATRRCGIAPVAVVVVQKIARSLRRLMGYA